MEKDFSEFASELKNQEEIVALIKIFNSDEFESEPVLKSYKDHDLNKLRNVLSHDHSGKKKIFREMLNDETKGNVLILEELTSILKKKNSAEELVCRDLLKKKENDYELWSKLTESVDTLQVENKRMTVEHNELLEKKSLLTTKRDFINYKMEEFGDEKRISELFEEWSAEHARAKAEKVKLEAELEKAREDEKVFPRLCNDARNNIKRLKADINHAKYEMQEILKAFPNIEDKAKESEEIVVKYKSVHEEMEKTAIILTDLREQISKVTEDEKYLREDLSKKKEELVPLVETETTLKTQLTDLTNKFNRQEELTDQAETLKGVINPLESKLKEWRSKVDNHERMSKKINEEIEKLKDESAEMASELKELESMVGPVKELRKKLEEAKKEVSTLKEQEEQSTSEIKKLTEENSLLSIKARQFDMIKKRMEGMK